MTGTVVENILQTFTLQVHFSEGSPPTFTLLDSERKPVEGTQIESYYATLVFELEVSGVPNPNAAVYASQFQWLDNKKNVIDIPPMVSFIRSSGTSVTLIDVNTNFSREVDVLHFLFSVVYDGQMYSSVDPVVINKKPPA